jgi:CBS domain containing-hemolysin-like protein
MNGDLLLIVLSLFFSACFSAAEMAFISADRLQVALRQGENSQTARSLRLFYENEDYFICTTLTGNTISLVLYGIFLARLLDEPIAWLIAVWLGDMNLSPTFLDILTMLAQTSVATVIVLAVAEFLPKTLALVNPMRTLLTLAFLMRLVYFVFYPFVWLIIRSTAFFVKISFGIKTTKNDKTKLGLADLNYYVENIDEQQQEVDKNLIKNAIEFKELKVRDCLIPRIDIVGIEKSEPIEKLRELFVKSGHSKIIVYEKDIDNVVGYCHALRMYDKPQKIEQIIESIIILPETAKINQLMVQFINQRKSIALITDEYGGTAGIVTVEDVVEEILGDIEDEHDEEQLLFQQIDDNTYQLTARHLIEELNKNYKWNLPEGDYETLGGYILSLHGNVPNEGEVIENERFSIEIQSMRGARIDRVRLTWKEKPERQEE